jgi:hypothetical protein
MHALAALRSVRLREHAVATAIFLVSRWLLQWAGVRFNLILDWMHLSDLDDLRFRLGETLWYSHSYPPGMNLLTGVLLKLDGSTPLLALAVFQFLGLVLLNSQLYLGRALGLSFPAALCMSVGLSLVPQTIYFENLYLYTYPTTALLGLAAAFFHGAVHRKSSFWRWFGFFFACAAIGWFRTTFHLVWLLAMIGLALAFADRGARRRVLGAAAIPLAFLLALYVKNLAVFGVFGTTTAGPANLTLVTIRHLPVETRDAWIREGKLSPYAAISVFAGPREYLPHFATSRNDKWPPMMNTLERPSSGAPNFNHWFFLEVQRQRRADALYYLKERPLEYAGTVLEGVKLMFQPSTEWHPNDQAVGAPHFQHRQVLGRYEHLYNRLVHGFPFAPVGLYVFLPLSYLWALATFWSHLRSRTPERLPGAAVLCFCLIQIGFVVLTCSLFTFRESARYRYEIEPMIWLIVGSSMAWVWARTMGRLRAAFHAPGPAPSRSFPS